MRVDAKSSVRGKGKVQDKYEGQFSFRSLNEQSQESRGSKLRISKSTEVKAIEMSQGGNLPLPMPILILLS